MRADRFLKLSRLVKRRTAACEMVSVGAVRLNGKAVKPSADVSAGDELAIAFPRRLLSVRVLTADEHDLKRGAPIFTITEDRRLEEGEKPW
ncbi:MAG: RNA-binding S4 domain-containing protein [Synergistaceae bacterium]|jgi:ribosomal 50S subunit-recycling heat shock protein|nr:RNA-binding S4 domain-containing protein [Synergistaceae bacterium]